MAVTENTTTEGNVSITKRTGTATAQKSPAGSSGDAIHASGTVPVNETVATTDKFILDPSAEDAVQTAGGQGSLDLPIHALENGVPDFDS